MNKVRFLSHLILAGLVSASLLVPPASAQASGDCYAIGTQQAAREGGQLARATSEMRGGQRVCVIVVLMPARDGQRPRRKEIVVPAG